MKKTFKIMLLVMVFMPHNTLTTALLAAETTTVQQNIPIGVTDNAISQSSSVSDTTNKSEAAARGFWELFFGFIGSGNASITKLGAFLVAVLLIYAGLKIRHIGPDNPLAPHAFELLVVTFILPVLLIVGILIEEGQEAVVGVLGTIVGYVFGAQRAIIRQDTTGQKEVEKTPPGKTDIEIGKT